MSGKMRFAETSRSRFASLRHSPREVFAYGLQAFIQFIEFSRKAAAPRPRELKKRCVWSAVY